MSEPAAGEPGVPGQPRRRRPWLVRVGGWLALVVLATLAPLFAALVLLHLPVGRAAVKAFVEEAGGRAAGGRLRLGALRYNLLGGRLDVAAVELESDGLSVKVQDVDLRYGPREGAVLRVVRPVIVSRATEKERPKEAATGLAARPWTALERFARVDLLEARVELRDASGAPSLVLAGLDATMHRENERRLVELTLGEGRLALGPEASLGPVRGEGRLAVERGALRVDRLRLTAGDSSLDAKGSLERLSPNEGAFTATAVLDAGLVRDLAPGAELTGRVEASAGLRLAGDDAGGTLRLATAPSLSWAGIGPLVGAARGRFDSRQLTVESLDLAGYSGRLRASGPLAIDGQSPTDIALRAEGLDVRALVRASADADLPVRSSLSGALRYTTAGLDVANGRATGTLALAPLPPAPVRRGGARGLPVAGSAALSVEGRALRLDALRLEAHGARVSGSLGLSPETTLDGRFDARLPLETAPELAADLGAARPLDVVGAIAASGEIRGPARDPAVELRVSGSDLAPAGQAARGAMSLEADASYAGGRLSVARAALRSGGGEAVFAGGLPATAAGGAWDLAGEVHAFDLGLALALAGIEGDGPLDGRVRIEGPHGSPRALADVDARLALAGSDEPVAVSASASFADGRLEVPRLDAQVAGGRVEGAGTYDPATRALTAKATATDVRLARLPMLPESIRRIDGAVAAKLDLSGTKEAPVGEVSVAVAEATLDGTAIPGLALEAKVDASRLEITGTSSKDGADSVFLHGGGPLEGDWPARLEVDVAAVPWQALLDAVAPALEGATIDARGRVVVEVPLRDPARLRYRGEGLAASGRVRHLEWGTEAFAVEGTGDEANVAGLRLSTRTTAPAGELTREERAEAGGTPPATASGTLAVDGRVPIAEGGAFDLRVTGEVALGAVEALVPESRVAGRASLQAHVAGTLAAPEIDGTFGVTGGRGRYGGTRVSAVQVSGRFAGREAVVERASARVLGGHFKASGSVPLAPLPQGRDAKLTFEAKDLDLARLAVPFAERTAESPSFFVSVSGELLAHAPSLEGLRGRGQLTRLESKSSEGTSALAAPAAWRLAEGKLVQEPLRLEGPLGTLEASAEATILGTPRGTVVLAGPFDLRLVSPFVPETTLAGPARVDLQARWDEAGGHLDGRLEVEDGRATLEELAFTASQIRGEVRFLGERAEMDATAATGDGRIVAYGGMSFAPSLLGPAALTIEAERVPIAYPEGFRARATGGLLVEGDAGRYRVSGLVDLRQAYYTAEFDARGQSLDRLDYQLAALRSQDSVADRLPLAVDVRLADPLRIRNSVGRLDVTGTITANGTLAQPVANGQVSLLGGGEITVRRARIRPLDGRVELNGYPGGVPEVDFSGLTQVGGVTMSLRAQGVMDDLQFEVTSPNRPDLSQSDLLSLILTGRTAQAAATEGGAIVAEELAAALGGALQKNVGETFLVDVSSDESMLLDEGDPSQRFRVGTRLPRNLSVIYSTRLDGTEQRWVGQWNPRGGRFTLRLIDDREEGQAVEATDRRTFDVFRRRRGEAAPAGPALQKLEALHLEGRLVIPEEELRKAAKLKVGQRYDALRLAQAADKVRSALVEAGWRSASVELYETPTEGRKGRVAVVLMVDPGPRVVLAWSGDDPGEKPRERALESWSPYASPEAAAAAVARAVRVDLQAQGFYEAGVEHEARVSPERVEVALRVRQGPRGKGVVVLFEGNEALSREQLLDALPKPGSREFFEALDRPVRLLAQARIAYAGAGHLRARLLAPQTRFDEKTARLEVTIRVREGPASVVGRIALPEEVTAAGAAGPELKLREGAPFDVEAYVADRDAIAAWYRREGWMEARVRGMLEPAGGTVGVQFAADAGPRPRLGEVRIASEGRTEEQMVRRALRVEPGETILPQQLAESRTRLSDLGTFSTIDLRTVPVEGRDDVRDLEVRYVERPDVELEYGLRYKISGTSSDPESGPSEGRLQAAVAATLANPFGWGWRLTGFTLQTLSRHNYRAGIESSTLFGLRVKTQLLGFDETLDEAAIAASFASKVRGFTLQQGRALLRANRGQRWHELLRLQWGYTNKDIQYSEEVGSDVLVSGNRAFLSLAAIGDWRDSLTDPRKGTFWTATVEWSRRYLGSDVDYNRYYAQLFTYLPLPGGLVWAQGYRAGVVPGDDPFFLLENRFQSGGPTTVRGFRQNGLGPQFDENEGFGGQGVFVFNQEIRFPIWKNVKGGVFWDAGNTWLLASEFSMRDVRHSVGGGLRIMFPFGPIRLEYGFILDRRQNSDGSFVEPRGRFVFGLGHAF